MTSQQALTALPAPPLQTTQWLNTPEPIDLSQLRGKVVLLHAFQMLCPGCISHGLPQAEKAHRAFKRDDFAVIGLHTVFEHHTVMGPEALKAFVHEYRWTFPIGIDRAGSGSIPVTMRDYGLQGTPSVVLLDRHGRVRLHHFGQIDDMVLGGAIGKLLAEEDAGETFAPDSAAALQHRTGCEDGACLPAPAT